MKPQRFGAFWLAIPIVTIHQLLATISLAGDPPEPNPAVRPGAAGSEVDPFIGTGGLT
jgi:hypothetical protein